MKKSISISFIFFVFVVSGLAQQQKIDSKIEHVTIFLNGAQVIRTATAQLPSGKSDIILKGLTPNLDAQSVIVKGEGDFTIMSVKHQMNFLEEIKRKDTITLLEAEREKLWGRGSRLKAETQVLEHEEEILQRNRVQIIGVQNNPTKPEDLKTLIEYQRTRLADILSKKIDLQNENEKIKVTLAKISNQLTELNARKSTATAEVVVTVFVKNATPSVSNAKLRLEYIVPNAGWLPIYDLRFKDVTSPVLAQMKAKVRQNSGEDWKDVKITLSTGEPKRSGIKPELGTWELGRYGSTFSGRIIDQISEFETDKLLRQLTGKVKGVIRDGETQEPLIGASVVVTGTSKGTVTNVDGQFELELPANAQTLTISYVGFESSTISAKQGDYMTIDLNEGAVLNEVVVTGYSSAKKDVTGAVTTLKEQQLSGRVAGVSVSPRGSTTKYVPPKVKMSGQVKENEKTTTTSFDIDLPYTIPTDAKEYQVEIKEVNVAATYQYSCVPKLDADAFLTAFITDWEQYSLIEGEANLYFEGTYLGKTLLKTQSVEDTLTISLGRDKNVVVKRTKLKEYGKGVALSSKRTDTRNFEISVKNKKSLPLSIVIEDQVPVSTDKSIEVNYEAKGAEYDKDKGRLTWKITLQPAEDRKINFSYSVKHPSDVRVVLD